MPGSLRRVRSFAALALAATMSGSSLGAVPMPFGAADDGCAGHTCECVRHCPPKRKAASGCHDKGDPSCEMRGACRHDGATTTLGNPLALEPENSGTEVSLDERPFRSFFPEADLTGFFRIDRKPPRT